MGTFIVLAVLAIVVLLGLRSARAHIQGQGGCCGGGGSTAVLAERKIPKGPVLYTRIAKISGMHCENCQNRVQNRLNRIDGLVAEVSYRSGNAKLYYEKEIADEVIRSTVKEAGYELVSLEEKR